MWVKLSNNMVTSVALQVGNPRGDAIVSDHLQFSHTSVSIKTQKYEV